MLQRDRVAVVDVADGDADDVRAKVAGDGLCARDRVARETKIEEPDIVTGGVEGRGHACQAVRDHRVRLALPIGADEKHPRSVICVCAHA